MALCSISALAVKLYEEHILITVLKVVLHLSKIFYGNGPHMLRKKDSDTLLTVVFLV